MTATHVTPGATDALAMKAPQHGTGNETTDQLIESARTLGPLIREHAEAAERERRIAKPVLDALSAAGFQRLLAPRALGGLEVDPITCAQIVEEVASFDSAAGWALQSANINAWWASRLPDKGAEEIYGSNPSRMVAAAFHPPQQATEVPGGYRVSGRSPLASMIHDCEWVLVSALVMEGGQPRMTQFGPEIVCVILPTADVEILDTWRSLGMRGTDSNDVAFTDVFVPTHRTFPVSPDPDRLGSHFPGPLYRFPAVAIIALFTAGVLMATARAAISELRELADRKTPFGSMKTLRDRGATQSTLAEAEAILRSARAFFYNTLSEAWARAVAGQENTLEHRADLLLASIHAVKSSVTVTELMHRLAGTSGIYTKSPLERYLRDAHTLRQHGFASENKLESVGQVYLGLPPDFPFVAF